MIKLFGEELMAAVEQIFDQQAVIGFSWRWWESWTPLFPAERRKQCSIPLHDEQQALPWWWAREQGVPQMLRMQQVDGQVKEREKKREREIWKGQLMWMSGWSCPLLASTSVCLRSPGLGWRGWELVVQGEGFAFRWEVEWTNSKTRGVTLCFIATGRL